MKIIIIILLIQTFSYHSKIYSDEERISGIGVGPTFSYNFSNKAEIVGFDLSYTGFSELMSDINIPVFMIVSLNPRIFNYYKGNNSYSFDLQVTWGYIINLGGGVGYLSSSNDYLNYHFFIGLPIPFFMTTNNIFNVFYIEPYYRLNFNSYGKSHELGFMIKMNTMNLYPR